MGPSRSQARGESGPQLMGGCTPRLGTNRACYQRTVSESVRKGTDERRLAVAATGCTTERARVGTDPGSYRQGLSGLADGLALDLNLDLLADHDATGLQCDVPGDAEGLPVDLGRGAEPEHVVPVRAAAHALQLDHEVDGHRHVLDGHLPRQHRLA